jgi:hypothetical protein
MVITSFVSLADFDRTGAEAEIAVAAGSSVHSRFIELRREICDKVDS